MNSQSEAICKTHSILKSMRGIIPRDEVLLPRKNVVKYISSYYGTKEGNFALNGLCPMMKKVALHYTDMMMMFDDGYEM